MAKKTRRRRSKKRRPDFFQKNKYRLVTMGIAGLIVVSLVMFARFEEQPPPQPVLPPVAKKVETPVQKPVVDYTQQVYAEVEALLAAHGSSRPQREMTPAPARYKVEGELPSVEMIGGFRQRLAGFPGGYKVIVQEPGSIAVEKSGQPVVVIQFSPPLAELPEGPLVAIIMDDLGRSTYTAQSLVSIPQHVTFSILPGETHAGKVAELAYRSGREVMLHVPMEPQGYPAVNPGDDALFVSYSETEISDRFNALLAAVPHVTGTNNHMGSRFTEDAQALAPVMKSLRQKGLFFIDSRTTGLSQVTDVANEYGVPTLSRDVFLDNVADVDAIVVQLGKLEARARRQGMAIGICHPYPETLEALRKTLPEQAGRGITFVPVSQLLQRQARL
jgi:polysaccharide deacetylase 2 family uncharacterized protein YibQ